MPANLYPYVTGSPILRTCRGVTVRRLAYKIKAHRVAQPSMCLTHIRTCSTCCNLLQRRCGLGPWEVPPQPERTAREILAGLADLARIRHELGFRPLTDEEAEDERQHALRNAKEETA